MAQVPYNPVPQEQLGNQPIPELQGSAVEEAFGGSVANAISSMGRTVAGVGNEIFQRAMAIQQLNNETEAREAETNFMIKAGELHANFNSLQGRAAYDAYPQYQKDLEAARQEIRQGVSNPHARKLYDSSTRSTLGRTIFNGASHAASQNRKWAGEVLEGQIAVDAQEVEEDPSDERLFTQKLERVKDATRERAALAGHDEDSPATKAAELNATSKLWSQRLIGLSRTKPFEAAQSLDRNKANLTQADFLRVDTAVRNSGRAVGSANIVNEVWAEGGSMEDMRAKVEARAKAEAPDDPLLGKAAIAALNTKFNQENYIEKQERANNIAAVEGAILGGAQNLQELRADPKIAAAVDALPKHIQNDLPGRINRINAARDQQTNQGNKVRLLGLKNTDPEAFLNTDLSKEKLSHSDLVTFMKEQQKMKDQPNADPRVQRAVGWLQGAIGNQLQALGVDRRTKDNAPDYDRFVGSLQVALDDWQQEHNKPAGYKDVVETIAPRIMREVTTPGSIFGNFWPNKTPFFNVEPKQEFVEQLTADVIAKGGDAPTPEQVQRAWTQKEWLRLYGKKKDEGRVK